MADKVNKKPISEMNLFEKIQHVKLELSKRELKKTGVNNFSKFNFYELGDFLPSIIELCAKYGLFTHITFKDKVLNEGFDEKEIGEKAILTIWDANYKKTDTSETENWCPSHIEYECDVKELTLKGANTIQNYGGTQTYLRRYLYMNAFDIVEADVFDEGKKIFEDLIKDCKNAFVNADETMKTQVGILMTKAGHKTFKDLSKSKDKKSLIALANLLNVEVPEEI